MNWDKIEQLLKIAETSVKWPNLRPIHDAAMKELHDHAHPPKPEPKVEVEAEAEAEDNGKLKRRAIDG